MREFAAAEHRGKKKKKKKKEKRKGRKKKPNAPTAPTAAHGDLTGNGDDQDGRCVSRVSRHLTTVGRIGGDGRSQSQLSCGGKSRGRARIRQPFACTPAAEQAGGKAMDGTPEDQPSEFASRGSAVEGEGNVAESPI